MNELQTKELEAKLGEMMEKTDQMVVSVKTAEEKTLALLQACDAMIASIDLLIARIQPTKAEETTLATMEKMGAIQSPKRKPRK